MGMRRLRQTDSDPGRTRPLFAPDPSVSRLTARELAVARLVADGLKDGEIARRLGIAASSVGGYVARVKLRLGLSHRNEIAAWVRARRAADDPEASLQRVEDGTRRNALTGERVREDRPDLMLASDQHQLVISEPINPLRA
jgi:DNA-binding CsgD family transcriptional regulator